MDNMSSTTNRTMRMVCAGLLAAAAVFNVIFAIIRLSEVTGYHNYYGSSPGFSVFLFIISLFAVAAGSGLAAFYLFTGKDAKIGFMVLAVGYGLLTVQQLISLIQYLQIARGFYYDGFWLFNIFTLISDAVLACVFFVYYRMTSFTNIDRKTLGTILLVAPAVSFISILISGAGADISIAPLQIIKTLFICGAAALLPFVFALVEIAASTGAPSTAAAETPGQTPKTVYETTQKMTVEPVLDLTPDSFAKIRHYKELFDKGVISEEDFNVIKKNVFDL